MRAVELLGCRVVGSDGRRLGTVHDLRLVAGAHAHGLSGYRLDALVTGSASIGSRLSCTGGQVTGLWPLPQLFARFSRQVYVVPWREVRGIDGKLIRLRVPVSRLVPGRPGSDLAAPPAGAARPTRHPTGHPTRHPGRGRPRGRSGP